MARNVPAVGTKVRFFVEGKQVFESVTASPSLTALKVDDVIELYGSRLRVAHKEQVLDLRTEETSNDFHLVSGPTRLQTEYVGQ